ncbi:uncharacterized protein N7496_004058 [Penicillium cataractarum]|uniref:SET domain-containing protein n=1 Tax=Penicillium cataractarum TaxID=2100454 RepID=A0A9W9SP94_9EURO|nr:uncharacterized protein N7496_004058 [Penicillium cataractarum]KAJ5381630.1 hypothetical protein N7496_004058 [Penicillium cataractarum]
MFTQDSSTLPAGASIFRVKDKRPAFAQDALEVCHKIITAMYWDLDTIWKLQQLVRGTPSQEETQAYRIHLESMKSFLDHAASYKYAYIFQFITGSSLDINRCLSFLFDHGWAFFTICAMSESFRKAFCGIESVFCWNEIMKIISANRRSIEVFIRSPPLLPYLDLNLPGICQAVNAKVNIGTEHAHHTVQMTSNFLKRPIHKGRAQANINSTVYKAASYRHIPLLRLHSVGPCAICICERNCSCHNLGGLPGCPRCHCPEVCRCSNPDWVTCFSCGSHENCQCVLNIMAGDLVELKEYPVKGTGVRALTNLKKGDVLGEYVGEFLPKGHKCTDEVYALWQVGFRGMWCLEDPGTQPVGTITSAFLGNWTRYINHHCEANCEFVPIMIGGRATTIVQVIRDIPMFDELTLHYGILAALRARGSRGAPGFPRPGRKLLQIVPRRSLLTNSYARGPSTPPLFESTVGEHFAKIVAEHGDRTAVVSKHQNDRISYASLDARSNALARGLESVGVRKGDRVGVMLGNSMEYAVATYALFKLGAILVPLNPSFNATQVVSALGHLESRYLIISAESNLPRKDPRSNVPLLEHLIGDLSSSKLESESVPSLKQIILVDNSAGRFDASSYKALTPFASIMSQMAADGRPLPPQNLSPHDIVNIQFTSGTTAMPKAACLSHRSILNNGSQIGDRMLLTPNDIVCCPPPLFHCFGCILGYMATATHGSAIVFPSESFNARAALKAVQEEKCTALYGVPTMFLEELNLIETGEISGDGFQYLRTGIAAGSSIPAELMRKLHRVLNLTELTICYGMTETSPVSAMTTTDDPIDKRINTVGRLMPHVEAKVVNPTEKSQILPVNMRGELAVSGYLLMKEYWNDPERTAEVMIADGEGKIWMHTGDEASMSADGYVTITGRIKDLIIRGGENIHPLEIENCLLAHPNVTDVSVVGVPDERYGEVVAAFVVAREQASKPPTIEEIQNWVREKLSNHLVPKYVFFLGSADAFPKTASGKIQKFKLKEQAIKLVARGKEAIADT